MFLRGLLLLFLQMGYVLNAGYVPSLSIIATKALLAKPLQKDQKWFEDPVVKEIIKQHSTSHLEPLTHSMPDNCISLKISEHDGVGFIRVFKSHQIQTKRYEHLHTNFSSAKKAMEKLLSMDAAAFARLFNKKFPSEVCTWEDIVKQDPDFNKIGCTYNLKNNASVTKYPMQNILFVYGEGDKPIVGINYSVKLKRKIEEEFDGLSLENKCFIAQINYAACAGIKLKVSDNKFDKIISRYLLHYYVRKIK